MNTTRIILVTALVAVLAALVAFFNPFSSEIEADTRALTFALEQFVGISFAVVGVLTYLIGRYRQQPLKWQMMVLGALIAIIGILVLFDPALTLNIISFLVPVKLIVSGFLKLNIGRKQMPGNLAWWIIGAGIVSILVGVIALLNFTKVTGFEIGTLLAVDLLGTGVMMAALAMQGKKEA